MEVAGCPVPSPAALWGSMNARLRLKKRYSCQSALQGPSDCGSEPYLTSLLRGRGESRDSIMSDQKQVSLSLQFYQRELLRVDSFLLLAERTEQFPSLPRKILFLFVWLFPKMLSLLAGLTEGALVSAVTGGVFSPREQAHDPH